jgi:formylglycine-generating enzyme required for sulfatase activity
MRPGFLAILVLSASFSALHAQKAGPEVTNSLGMKLMSLPAGKMTARLDAEDFPIGPVLSVEIEVKKPFLIGVTEVTQAQYEKVMGSNPSGFSPRGDNWHRVRGLDTKGFPAENVTWDEAREFCRKLSEMPEEKKAGRKYMLPTGDQWEYAARAGSSEDVLYAFGATLSSKQANFNGLRPHGESAKGLYLARPEKVGSFKPNAWGLHDMHGNVWEWCQDDYAGFDGKVDRERKTLRGGSWINRGRDCAASTRLGLLPTSRYNNVGFRVVCIVEAPESK